MSSALSHILTGRAWICDAHLSGLGINSNTPTPSPSCLVHTELALAALEESTALTPEPTAEIEVTEKGRELSPGLNKCPL